MNGPGLGTALPPPRPRDEGAAVTLRVLCVVVGFASFSLLNWALLLRLALVRRRTADWVVFAVVGLVLPIIFFSLAGSSDSEDIAGPVDATGVIGIIVLWLCVPFYFLGMDGHYRRLAQQAAALPAFYAGPAPAPYPYAPPQAPPSYEAKPYDYNPYRTAAAPPPITPSPMPSSPTPPPQPPPPPPRLNQVRAELDELSDLLREQEGDGR
jgi:hypothetical protein